VQITAGANKSTACQVGPDPRFCIHNSTKWATGSQTLLQILHMSHLSMLLSGSHHCCLESSTFCRIVRVCDLFASESLIIIVLESYSALVMSTVDPTISGTKDRSHRISSRASPPALRKNAKNDVLLVQGYDSGKLRKKLFHDP
jgi:hypothetical protein